MTDPSEVEPPKFSETAGVEASQQMIGFLMSKLIKNGTRKCEINPVELFIDEEFDAVRHDPFNTEARSTVVEPDPKQLGLQLLCGDTMDWLIKEGLARADGQTDTIGGHSYFRGVHLTAKGMTLAGQPNQEIFGGRNAIETIDENPNNSDLYQNLGSFFGSAIAGFTKGIS